MALNSSIEWTEGTWNPVTGCTKISPGCKHCLSQNTRILYGDMTWRPIGDARVGDQVISVTDNLTLGANRKVEIATIEAIWPSKKPAIELMVDYRVIVCSEDHRWLADVRPWWRFTRNLNLGVRLRTLGNPDLMACTDSPPYRAGYIAGVTLGDGTMRWNDNWRSDKLGFPQSYWRVALVADDRIVLDRLVDYLRSFGVCVEIRHFDSGTRNPKHKPMLKLETRALSTLAIIANLCKEQENLEWKAGWLAGMYDAEGGYSGNVRIAQKDAAVLERVCCYAAELGFGFGLEQFPKQRNANTVRLKGGVNTRVNFFSRIQPVLSRKCSDMHGRIYEGGTAEVTGLRRVGMQELVDIQTSSGTFVAEGIVTHNCYAERMAIRLAWMKQPRYRNGFDVTLHPDLVRAPIQWRRARTIFVNSMSDLFHEDVPEPFIAEVFDTMVAAHWHTFQILTKRANRLAELAPRLTWPVNVWMGVSVESPRYVHRIERLRAVPAAVRFLSVEPLLARIASLPLGGIDWVIVGGESGPGARPMSPDWAREIRDVCLAQGVPFFFKQWGGTRKNRTGRVLDGCTWDEMPTPVLRQLPGKGLAATRRGLSQMPLLQINPSPCAD